MRRRRVRESAETILFIFAMFCVSVVIIYGFKERLLCFVNPGVAYITEGYDEQGYRFTEGVFSLFHGFYGYVKKERQPELYVQDEMRIRSSFSETEQLPEEKEGLHNEGMAKDETTEELFISSDAENKIVAENKGNGEFIAATEKVRTLDYEKLLDVTYLRKNFYTVDNSTDIGADLLDARAMLSYDATVSQDHSKPQILIYHTHSQEGFADSVPGDASTTVVGVGDRLAEILQEEYGFQVIHHKGTYDLDSRDYAYSAAGPAIEKILEENPSIEVVIDLHRDGVAETTRLVSDVGGRPTAQFMFFNGLSYMKGKGYVDYLENPYIRENLAFSFQMKLAAEEYYPGVTRSIYLKSMRYNMHFKPKTLLLEVGAQTNTVEEAMNAMDPVAHILAMVLNGEKP